MMMFVRKVTLRKVPMEDFNKISALLDENGIEYEAKQSKEDKKRVDLVCNSSDMTEVIKAVSKVVAERGKKL